MSPILEEEDEKIRAFVNTPALDWSQFRGDNKVVHHHRRRSFTWVRTTTTTMTTSQPSLPPLGYVCKKCGIQGHYVHHCATNGDPNYDIKKVVSVKPTTPNPDEAAFEVSIGSALKKKKSECAINVSPCTLCKKAMKDAVMSRCCLESFCDKCIRDYLMNSKMRCVCGASGVLTDYLVPNMAIRGLINRILLESENGEEEISRVAKKARTGGGHVNKDFRAFHSLASHVY